MLISKIKQQGEPQVAEIVKQQEEAAKDKTPEQTTA
jgi:hypothetical protein